MAGCIFFIIVLHPAVSANSVRVDVPVGSGGYDEEVLQYDDGSGYWLTWGGTYRGVWFNTQDFSPGSTGFMLEAMEWWFYQMPGYPWETSEFYAQVYNGGQGGPAELLASQQLSAVHYSAVFTYYDPPLECESNFWGVENTVLSSGGWPSSLGDGTPGEHSFYSDDFIIWESWGNLGDYFIRAHGESSVSLERASWGSVKALF
jgi:hypothetical protein